MDASPDFVLVRNFFIALLIGALVGVEREKHKTATAELTFGGLRTFILFSEAGAVSAWLSVQLGAPWIFAFALFAVAAVVTVGYVMEGRASPAQLGLTTELAAITVFLLGGAVMYGYVEIAVALAIVTSSVLAFKQPLHGVVERLGMDDIYAGLKLLIATFIVLPLLPHRPIDPWGALDPYAIWLLVILISTLSLAGYVAVRWLGNARGAIVTGLSGGFVSSTAASLAFVRQSRTVTAPTAIDALCAGILVAWTVMFVRVAVTVSVVNPALVRGIALPFGLMAASAAVATAIFYLRGQRRRREPPPEPTEVPLKNPFSLWEASKFGLVFAVVLLVIVGTQRHLAGRGLYLVAALAGSTDVDAITLSLARLARQGVAPATAEQAIVVASVTNTLVKFGFAAALGAAELRARLVPATVAIVVFGAIGAWLR
jgi:uncharacterized membrane protein (DUF4010 family)